VAPLTLPDFHDKQSTVAVMLVKQILCMLPLHCVTASDEVVHEGCCCAVDMQIRG
jgi:hypothetical protein